jgi:archaetidylinositol phosphate synthase
MTAARVNRSILAKKEQEVISFFLLCIPANVAPIHLTILGLVGAGITSMGLLACNFSSVFVIFVIFGLFLHWFGDSLDGSLARFRQMERPRFGFLVDHGSDLIAMTIIIISFGFSPFLTPPSALVVLCLYLLFSSYTYIKVAVEQVHQLAYGGLGGTEFRMLMASWALVATAMGPRVHSSEFAGIPTVDLVMGIMALGAFAGFAGMLYRDTARIGHEERREPCSTEFGRNPRAPTPPFAGCERRLGYRIRNFRRTSSAGSELRRQ